ncbi:MAG: plasmid replication/partition related protein [Burkholderiales bacterium RIFOXYC12_FULL_65_23]|uniref:plasmid replication/partition related protein n=1 Tax=Malikia spinosa TaxID=86180 RepID=UPI0008C94AC3|nr:plasmid replication/partition related protein [Malikia spinosa]OGB72501.1 MAG: plasmid replication/partition related protein [Burkholderiales bacterium RIFOXYC12_FULL_65_23]
MDIVVNEELKAYIDPLTPEEYAALERSLLAEGCRDALVLWGDLLVDGHNRYAICRQHGLPFQTVQSKRFKDIEDVHLWMIDQHLGRRSVSDFQRGVLALRQREIVAARRARFLEASAQPAQQGAADAPAPQSAAAEDLPWEGESSYPEPAPLKSREDLARAARLSSSQVAMIEKIQQQAEPELVAALKSGAISINAAAAVATLPPEQQKAAAVAGKDELKQAAKRVREAQRKPRAKTAAQAGEGAASDSSDPSVAADQAGELQALQQRVAELTAENEALRKQVTNLLSQLVG